MTQSVNFYLMKSYVREIIDIWDFQGGVQRGFGGLRVYLSHLYRCRSIVRISDKSVRHGAQHKPWCDFLHSTWPRTAENERTILANESWKFESNTTLKYLRSTHTCDSYLRLSSEIHRQSIMGNYAFVALTEQENHSNHVELLRP